MARPKKLNGGRPTDFKPEYTQELVKFFDIEPYKQVITEESKEYTKDGDVRKESNKYRFLPNRMPTLYRFARKIKVDYTTVWRWANGGEITAIENKIDKAIQDGKATPDDIKHLQDLKLFCNAYNEAKELQKDFIINIGLAGAAPAPFAIFTAKNVTDMRDKVETDITSGGKVIQSNVITFANFKNETDSNSK